MKEFKGTKGPWFEHREGSSTVYVEAKLRDGVIQEVAACGPTEAGSEAQSANARLIAAAPDLLKSILNMVERIEYYASISGQNVPNIEDWAYTYNSSDMDHARNAIAKALGETK